MFGLALEIQNRSKQRDSAVAGKDIVLGCVRVTEETIAASVVAWTFKTLKWLGM